jgi:dihydrodipicolinate reductase
MNRKEAEAKFETAINEYLSVVDPAEGFLVDWSLITAHHVPHDDGESGTALAMYVNAQQAIYRSVGLVHYAVALLEKRMKKEG